MFFKYKTEKKHSKVCINLFLIMLSDSSYMFVTLFFIEKSNDRYAGLDFFMTILFEIFHHLVDLFNLHCLAKQL